MLDQLVNVPSPSQGENAGYVSLTKTAQGRLLRKQILPMNSSFIHPADPATKIYIDKTFADKLKKNFDAGYSIVQVPLVNDDNKHVESPDRNTGEVIDIDYDDSGVYATIDARKYADDFGKTILGASAFMHLNYPDTTTGERVGPTLLHVAATNRPYINGLDGYKDILKASADISDEETILFMREETQQDKDKISLSNLEDGSMFPDDATQDDVLAAVKEKFGIDVAELQTKATEATELSAQLDEAKEEIVKLSGGSEKVPEDLAEAIVALSASNDTAKAEIEDLKAANAKYQLEKAQAEVDGYVKSGHLLPKQRELAVRLSMKNREDFEAMLPENPVVKLSEEGFAVHEQSNSEATKKAVEHYLALAKEQSGASA